MPLGDKTVSVYKTTDTLYTPDKVASELEYTYADRTDYLTEIKQYTPERPPQHKVHLRQERQHHTGEVCLVREWRNSCVMTDKHIFALQFPAAFGMRGFFHAHFYIKVKYSLIC